MIFMAIASMLTSSEGTTEFHAHFALLFNENVKRVFINHRQTISADKSKQTSTFLEIRNLNESSFKLHESSFEHLLSYLSLSISGLLDMWLRLLTFYFKGS